MMVVPLLLLPPLLFLERIDLIESIVAMFFRKGHSYFLDWLDEIDACSSVENWDVRRFASVSFFFLEVDF